MWFLLVCTWKRQEDNTSSPYKGTNGIVRATLSWPHLTLLPAKAPPPNTLGVRALIYEGGGQTFSPWQWASLTSCPPISPHKSSTSAPDGGTTHCKQFSHSDNWFNNGLSRKYTVQRLPVISNFYFISRELNFRFFPWGSKLATFGSNLIHRYFFLMPRLVLKTLNGLPVLEV